MTVEDIHKKIEERRNEMMDRLIRAFRDAERLAEQEDVVTSGDFLDALNQDEVPCL